MVSPGDFIKIEYTGKEQNGHVFDSTHGEVAKKLHGREGPLLAVLGSGMLLPGLQEALEQMKKGEEREVELSPDQAFGHRHKQLLKVFAEKELHKFDILPQAGLHVELDSEEGKMIGTIRSVNSGRVVIDFNHPLADQKVRYTVKLVDAAHETSDKIRFLLDEWELEGTVKLEKQRLALQLKKMPEEKKKEELSITIRQLFPEIKEVEIK